MTGPEHYREAERMLDAVEVLEDAALVPELLAIAQVHATLALATPAVVAEAAGR